MIKHFQNVSDCIAQTFVYKLVGQASVVYNNEMCCRVMLKTFSVFLSID